LNSPSQVPADGPLLEDVLARFTDRFSKPSEELPSARCVPRPLLIRALNRIQDELGVPSSKKISGKKQLERLKKSGLAAPILVQDLQTEEMEDRFYVLGLGPRADEVSPLEILMALEPQGVICYFSALQFHSLTTQIPPHHHIARLADWQSKSMAAATGTLSSDRPFNPLGKAQFRFQGTVYYVTSRDRALLPGIQTRHLNDKTLIRITNLEQTLLDVLHRPLSCGGPEVVLEAWENGLETLHEPRLTQYLDQMKDPALLRRVGYLMQSLDYESRPALRDRINRIRRADATVIPLFQGYNPSYTDPDWNLDLP
jgi:predicted transcriptional regulator of viral defense system